MKIYAHRGVSAHFPENTLAAFRAALDAGVDGIELDVHRSADGVPVVIHDDRLERTTSGMGSVADFDLASLKTLDAGQGERIPTLEEVVELVDGRLHFDIEIKGAGCERSVLDVLDRHPRTRAAISSFDWNILTTIRSLSRIELWILTPVVNDEAIAAAERLAATSLAVFHRSIDEAAMARAREANLAIMAWTVNELEEAERLRDLGVIAICSDDPAAVRHER